MSVLTVTSILSCYSNAIHLCRGATSQVYIIKIAPLLSTFFISIASLIKKQRNSLRCQL